MSKYGGSEKTTQAFVAAYNKSRLSTRSSKAEAPAGSLLRTREDGSSPPPLPRLSGLFQPRSDVGSGMLGPCWMSQDPRHLTGPSQGRPALFHHLFPQQTELSVPFDPRPPAQEQHAVLWCAPAPPCLSLFLSFLAATCGDRIRLCGVVNVLIM